MMVLVQNAPCLKQCLHACRQEVLEDMPPFLGGGEMIEVRLLTSDALCKHRASDTCLRLLTETLF